MSKRLRADLLLLLITAIWGASFTLMKNVLEHIPSFAYLSLRFLIASIILSIVFWKSIRNLNKKIFLYGSIIGLLLFGGMALQVSGLYYTTASNSAFITGLNVVMVPIVSAILLKKKPDVSSVIGVCLAFLGLFFLSGGLNFKFNIGDILTLLCALCFTFQIIFIDKYTQNNDPILIALVQIGFVTLPSFLFWGGTGFQGFEMSTTVITTLLITGVLGTALAFAGQTIVQRNTTPTHTALIFSAEPLFGAIFAMLIPNSLGVTEALGVTASIGCALILGGMIISEFKIGTNKCIVELVE